MRRSTSLVILLFILTFISCRKIKNNIPTANNDTQTVQADIFGQVTDETGIPIIGAIVKTSTHTFITDSNGVFQFVNISTSKNRTVLEVTKQNYFKGFRTMYIIPGQDNYTRIMMIEKKNAANFNAASGGTINVNGGGTITFTANSIVNKSTGALYSGNVNVYSTWIDPTSNKLGELIPGALRGTDNNEEEKLLESYGMVGAELYDDNNQPLQIASGSTAQISFPVPAILSANAPSSIPLWYFDETNGMWKEQGTAQIQGNSYIGNVSHFTFWNCDQPANFVHFEAIIKNTAGTPLANIKVRITNVINSTSRYGLTNSNGKVEGAIPKNSNLLIEVLIDDCNTILYSQNISTSASDINLNNIVISVPAINEIIVSGTAFNCTNEIIKNGYIKYKYNNIVKFIKVSSNGNFVTGMIECYTPVNVKLTAYDIVENTYGAETNYILTFGQNNIGSLSACGNTYAQFVKCENTINGVKTSYTITDIMGIFEGGINNDMGQIINGISAGDSLQQLGVAFAFDGFQSINGNHYLKYFGDHLDYDITGDTAYSYINSIIPVTLSRYEAIGGKIEGSFQGNIKGLNIPDRNVKCTFKVNRTH